MAITCVKCGSETNTPSNPGVNDHCAVPCWRDGPAVQLKSWLEDRGFDFGDKPKEPA